MQLLSTLAGFLRDLKAQKLRTTLTVFGIIWGTVAIVVLLAFGSGFQKQTMKTMYGIGESILLVFSGRTSVPFEGYGRDRRIRFQYEDIELVRSEIDDIEYISPEYSNWEAPLRVGTRMRSPNVTGIIPEYSIMRNIQPDEKSRFINKLDIEHRRRVVFLGDELAEYLFPDSDPLGQYVYIGDTPFRVIGVMLHKEQDSSYNSRDKDRAFIPESTFRAVFGNRYMSNMVIKPKDPRRSPGIQKRLYEVLGKKYKFDPEDEDALSIWDTTEFQKMIMYLFIGFNGFMAIIGMFTLTVGGIGVANIMYVVVQERTREIGIKRSVGARKKHIMGQFFLETLFIIMLGASIGFAISLLILAGITMLPIDQFVGTPEISGWVLATALALLSGIGLLAGYFPARKAANMDIVECLR